MKRELVYCVGGNRTWRSVYAGRSGWTVVFGSRISGTRTGTIVHVPYGGDFPRGADLSRPWNEYSDHGNALSNRAYGATFAPYAWRGKMRLLRRGEVVR